MEVPNDRQTVSLLYLRAGSEGKGKVNSKNERGHI